MLQSTSNDVDNLIDANIEAFAAKEATLTTWKCVESEDKCHAECGNCHTIVENEGQLKGFHVCIGY